MTTLATTSDGNTPLSPEELADLIPNLATKEELNEWERENVLRGREWATSERTSPLDAISTNTSESCTRRCSTKRGSGPGSTGAPKKASGFQSIKSEIGLSRCSVTLDIGFRTGRTLPMK
jgi:hypothetical protein